MDKEVNLAAIWYLKLLSLRRPEILTKNFGLLYSYRKIISDPKNYQKFRVLPTPCGVCLNCKHIHEGAEQICIPVCYRCIDSVDQKLAWYYYIRCEDMQMLYGLLNSEIQQKIKQLLVTKEILYYGAHNNPALHKTTNDAAEEPKF